MERVIFTLSYEKKWDCWMVYAVRAEDRGDFFQSIGRYTGEALDVPSLVKEIFPCIRKYDTPALFRQFGRRKFKDEREFLQKVETEYIRTTIRPYIEQCVAQVMDQLADAGFPLFIKGSRLDNFYKHQRITLEPLPLRALLRFERTGEFTRYLLRLTDGKRVFYPSDYQLTILTRQPCRVLAGRQLFRFPGDFDGQRLTPFLQKREVMIPKANEQLYFRRFILKNIRNEEIEVQGFEVIVREVERKAVLSFEREIQGLPVLSLGFYYGNQWIPAWSERKVLVELHTEGDSYAFYKVNRNREWEEEQGFRLEGSGLERIACGVYRVKGAAGLSEAENNREEEVQQAWSDTVAWLREHRVDLQQWGIGLVQHALRRPYYTGGWRTDFTVTEETDWFEIRATVVLDDGRCIPLTRFQEYILSGKREYVLEDGTVFILPEEWFSTYSEVLLFGSVRGDTLFLHRNQYSLLDQEGWRPPEVKNGAEEIALPVGLGTLLRPYQRTGYEWLYRLYRQQLGGCLADDMGLGKTVQVIALLLKYREETVRKTREWKQPVAGMQLSLFAEAVPAEPVPAENPGAEFHTCLVVVPASLVHNWRNEFRRFAPALSVTVYAGGGRNALRPYLQCSDVVIVTYHTLRNDIEYLQRLSFGVVIADEAQMLKNPGSQLHQAMLRIRRKWCFALSGTPVENSLTDLWAVMNLVNRDMLGNRHFFSNHFIRPILADIGGRRNEALRKLIAPYILRRTKEEVLTELPELTSGLILCEPEEEQRSLYEEEQARVRNYMLDKHRQQESLRNDFMVLKALIRLRQMANHPRLVDPAYTGGSGKFGEVFRMLGEVTETGHKVLVFSSFVKYLEMVATEASRRSWKYALLTGSTQDREQEIRRFTGDPECRIFLISLKAGGVGLNLTEADYVFILDPWWNLAAENQAVSRAHRMGQKRAVMVYRFITAGTLEEKMLAVQRRKQQLADAVILPSAPVPLTDEELMEVI